MTSPLHIFDEPNGHGATLYNVIAKDICFLYHELAPYNYIMGDLDYREFSLDYWEALNRIDGGHCDDRFVRGGILILSLTMISDGLDGQGNPLTTDSAKAKAALSSFCPEDADMLRLLLACEQGLDLLATTGRGDDQFENDCIWAYDVFVRSYFAENSSRPKGPGADEQADATERP